MTDTQHSSDIQALVNAWKPYLATVDNWQKLIRGVDPKSTSCGPVYELANLLARPDESFSVADMRGVAFAQPHYHANGEVEVYFVLEGSGQVVVGAEVVPVVQGSVVVTPSGTTHYAIPDKAKGLVLAVVNTPPFSPRNNIEVTKTEPAVGYDHEQFKKLTINA